jgi:hypothetical protein
VRSIRKNSNWFYHRDERPPRITTERREDENYHARSFSGRTKRIVPIMGFMERHRGTSEPLNGTSEPPK